MIAPRKFTISFDRARHTLHLDADYTTKVWCQSQGYESVLIAIVELLHDNFRDLPFVPGPRGSLPEVAGHFRRLLTSAFPDEAFIVDVEPEKYDCTCH